MHIFVSHGDQKSKSSSKVKLMATLPNLLKEIRACRACESHLPHGPRPILTAHRSATILIAGQAPGRKVHESGTPWDDVSGDRLRGWLGIDRTTFYDTRKIALIPMGFCYPGTGTSGDLPPRPECRKLWHHRLLPLLTEVTLTIVIGRYAQAHYLGERQKHNLTATVHAWREFSPTLFPLPHPSPRNQLWLKKNPWFASLLLPELKQAVARALRQATTARASYK